MFSLSRPFAAISLLLGVAIFALTFAMPQVSRALRLGAGEIAFESDEGGSSDIYLLDIATNRRFNLTRSDEDEHHPSWSPDGARLVFQSDAAWNRNSALYVMDADGRNRQPLSDGTRDYWRPAWSPDGERIAFMDGYRGLRVMTLVDEAVEQVGFGFAPAWSTDSSYLIYYDSPNAGLEGDLYVIDLNSAYIRNLTWNPANDWGPAWSPDGSTIAFASAREGDSELYLFDAVCTRPESPQGSCDQSMRRLTHSRATDYAPSWSPDGRWLVYASQLGVNYRIMLMDLDTGATQMLVTGTANVRAPVWRPIK